MQLFVGASMRAPQALDALGAHVAARFAQQLMREQSAAHADLAMNAPYRQFDAFFVERFLPCEHMLIHAVDERAVEVEQKRCRNTHEVFSWV